MNFARASYPFRAEHGYELSLALNDVIAAVEIVDESWCKGVLVSSGASGYVPAAFIEFFQPESVVATDEFNTGQSDDLKFSTDDVIYRLSQVDDNWSIGFSNGRAGLYPNIYVTARDNATPSENHTSQDNSPEYANKQMFDLNPSYPQYANFPHSKNHSQNNNHSKFSNDTNHSKQSSKNSNFSDQFDHLEPVSPDEFDHLEDPSEMIADLAKQLERQSELRPKELIRESDFTVKNEQVKQNLNLELELSSVLDNLESFETRLLTPTYANGPQTHIYNLDKPKPMDYALETSPSNQSADRNAKSDLKLEKQLMKLEKKFPVGKLDVYDSPSKQTITNKPLPAVKRRLPKTPEKYFPPNTPRKLPTAVNSPSQPFNTSGIVKVLPTIDQHQLILGGKPKRIAPPPPPVPNHIPRCYTEQSLSKTDSFCTLTSSILDEQQKLTPPATPPNQYPPPFRRVRSSGEIVPLSPTPGQRHNCVSPKSKQMGMHSRLVTSHSRSLNGSSSDESRSATQLEDDLFHQSEVSRRRRRPTNGMASPSSPQSPTSSTSPRYPRSPTSPRSQTSSRSPRSPSGRVEQSRHNPLVHQDVSYSEYPGLLEVQQHIDEMERKLEVEEKMHSCLQTMLQVVTGFDSAKEEQLEVRQMECEHEIQEIQDNLLHLNSEKERLLSEPIGGDSPNSTPLHSKTSSPDKIMQSIATLESQIEGEERFLETLERQLDIPLEMVARQEILTKIHHSRSKLQILISELQNRRAAVAPAADPRISRLEQRQYVLDEIVQTERDFSKHLYLTCTYVLQACRDANIPQTDIGILFGNLEAISIVSEKLLAGLQETLRNVIEKQTIGLCFLMNARDLKDSYASYCRNLDEALTLLDKYDEDHAIHGVLEYGLSQIRSHVQCWDLPSILIKPMQRILKYPLLLGDLVKCTEDLHPDKKHLISAAKLMGEVANQINEVKRRKDLVLKYHVNEQGLKSKLENMNWHSVIKKTRRVNQIILKSAGINTSTVDEVFQAEERRFKELEKTLKSVVKSITTQLTYLQESLDNRLVVCEELSEFCNGKELPSVTAYNTIYKHAISEHIFPQFSTSVNVRVLQPIQNLLGLFQGPLHLIQKRNDKLLDYDSCLNKAEKTRDIAKLKSMKDELQLAKLNYEALNQQLLDDIPKFCSMSEEYLQKCLSALIHSVSAYFTKMELAFKKIAKPLPSDLSEIEKSHLERLHRACCAMCNLHFIPASFSVVRINRLPGKPDVRPIRPVRPIAGVGNSQDMNLLSNANLTPHSKDYIAKHQYTATNAIEITVHPGDIVKVIEPHDTVGNTEWWFVLLGNQTGYAPASYLAECTEEELARMEELETEPRYAKAAEEFYYSEFPFEAREKIEVSLSEGQVVSVIRRNDMEGNTEWWLIEADDKIGYVPGSYLIPIEQ